MSNLKKLNAWGVLVNQSNRYYLFEDMNIIGRNKKAFLCLKDPALSRNHCIVGRTQDMITIQDLSSSGTYVNNKRLKKNDIQELHHHDRITLANLDHHSYLFVENRKFRNYTKQSQMLDSRLKEEVINLDHSFSSEIEKLNRELQKMEQEKADLKENMNERLEAQANMFEQDRRCLTNLLSDKNKEKENLCELEENRKAEVDRLKSEMQSKIAEITKKEEELQNLKENMELRYQREKEELEERFKKEVEELKGKLAESDVNLQAMEQKLEETRKVIEESEIEQFRLFEEKMEVETKLGTKTIDLTKAIEENASKDEMVKDLEKKLQEKEEAEKKVKTEMEGLEEELLCSICAELFIESTVLNCGHVFCKLCIDEWKKKKKNCPVCRSKIVTSVRSKSVDSIIEKSVRLMTADARQHRETLIKERLQSHLPAKKRKRNQPIPNVVNPPPPHTVINERVPRVVIDAPVRPVELNDEFSWRGPQRVNSRLLRIGPVEARLHNIHNIVEAILRPLDNPVTVAAIDLTNVPQTPTTRTATHTATATATATSTAQEETIDLTTL